MGINGKWLYNGFINSLFLEICKLKTETALANGAEFDLGDL